MKLSRHLTKLFVIALLSLTAIGMGTSALTHHHITKLTSNELFIPSAFKVFMPASMPTLVTQAGGATLSPFVIAAPQSSGGCATASFAAATNFVVGNSPLSIVTGDFNGDGKVDLATITSTVSVLLSNGAGGFAATTSVGVLPGAFSASVSDFNGDGNADLVITHDVARDGIPSNEISVLLGNGAGGFASPVILTAGTSPRSVTINDFNSDGKVDLAVANRGSRNVSVLLGNSAGGFAMATNFAVAIAPASLVTDDFNGDGKADLAVANLGSNSISMLLGDGAGSFGTAASFAVGTFPNSVAAGDFNGDGKADLAAGNGGSNDVSVLLGDGAGSFATAVSFAAGTSPGSVTVGDFNGDGKADLATGNMGSNNVSVLLGNGTGGFATATNFAAGNGARPITLGDFNSDGKVDIATANSSSNNISLLVNNSCTTPPTNTTPTITAAAALTRQQGSTGTISTIATVTDAETAAGNLTVTATTVPTGITITNITNTNGTIAALVTARCDALVGANSVVLNVSDGAATATANLIVNVSANTPPQPPLYSPANVTLGQSQTITPSSLARDNGSITDISIAPNFGFTGGISVSLTSGIINITNASPVGTHTFIITATDNCGLRGQTTFSLTVGAGTNTPPRITLTGVVTRELGASGTALIATVSDAETPAGNLTVVASEPSGITISNITNNNGSITANVSVSANAIPNSTYIVDLYVTDGGGLTARAQLNIFAKSSGNTGTGTNISLTSNNTTVTFSNVTTPGNTTITPITPAAAGTLPSGYTLANGSLAFEVTTTAVFSGPITLTFNVPGVTDATVFSTLRVLHGEGSPQALVDRTVLAPDTPAPSFATKQISARVTSLSPFVIATVQGTLDDNWDVSLPDVDDDVSAIAVSGSDVYVGGFLMNADGVNVNGIAKLNGINWSALGSGVSGLLATVNAIAVNGSDVYVGGQFTMAGGVSASNIAKWNGSSWSALGSGIINGGSGYKVSAIAVSGNDVYVGGRFTTAGSVFVSSIAKWNGTTWSALGSGVSGVAIPDVRAIAVSGSDVYVGGYFTTAGGVSANNIAKWNGTTWSALGSGVSRVGTPDVRAIAVSGSNVYVGGYFTTAGGVSANNIAKWNGASWSALGSGEGGVNGEVRAIAAIANDVYVGGRFTTASGVSANNIAKWNGASWSALGSGISGINSAVNAIAGSNSAVYVGGFFSMSGDNPLKNVARYLPGGMLLNTPPTISATATPVRQQGSSGTVSPIATVSDSENAAGSLTMTATTIPTGLTITNLTNTNGTVAAQVAAACNVTIGANTIVLTVSDGALTSTANVTVNVAANTAPVLGTYANTALDAGLSLSVQPSAAPTDNGTIATQTATAAAGFTGTLAVNQTNGAVTINNAAPVGTHTLTVTATDNCGATATRTFTLTVSAAGAGCAEPSFAAAANFAVGSNPQSVGVGDFNGDGKADVATANLFSNNVSVLLGNGTGGFAAATNYPVGENPYSVAVGDFNGDSKADLAVANNVSNTVSVLLGNGIGGFAAATNFPAGMDSRFVTVGDFNGDGKADLAVSNPESATISVLLGNGMGGFAAATSFATGGDPYGAVVGDFNGDGKADLATANFSSNNVSLLLGNGTGGFAVASTFLAGRNPSSVAVGDFNGDGKADLAAGNFGFLTVSVLLGNGTGGFAAAMDYAVGSNPSSIAVGDFNGDGKADLATSNQLSNNASVLLGNGTGGFASATNFTVEAAPSAVAVGNFNSDGKLDLAVTNGTPGNVSVLLNTNTCNTPPTITAAQLAPSFGQGHRSVGLFRVATVNDAETPAGNLTVTATTLPTGLALTNFTNNQGAVSAEITATCSAAIGDNTIVLTVTDAAGATATANLIVRVAANTPPGLGTYANTTVTAGNATMVAPSTAPFEGGTITNFTVTGLTGAPTGTVATVNAMTGVVTIPNTVPAGSYTMTVQAVNNCGLDTVRTFTLTVVATNTPPLIGTSGTTARQGSAGTIQQIATVSDVQTAAGQLTVTATTAPNGITISNITNNGGTVTANIAAACNATVGNNTVVLTVSDGTLTATANLTIAVAENTLPELGTYANMSVAAGSGATVTPSAPPSDTGSVRSLTVAGVTGATINATTGVVTIPNNVPAGNYTATVTATDNCGATTTRTFTVTVSTVVCASNADYRFSNSLNTTVGSAPVLNGLGVNSFGVATVDGAARNVLRFNKNSGLSLSPTTGVISNQAYSIVMLFAFDEISGYRRIVDFSNGTQDIGLYNLDGKLAFYNVSTSNTATPIAANEFVQVVLTRDLNKNVTGYVNGTQQFAFTDNADLAVINNSNLLRFFIDEGPVPGEASAGSVARLRLLNCVLSPAEVAALDRAVGAPANTPPTLTAAAALIRQQGSPGTASTIATVNDTQTAAGSLIVTATTVPTGITVSNITNTNGTITANVAAAANATVGNNTIILTVTDGGGLTATANLIVNVTAPPPPPPTGCVVTNLQQPTNYATADTPSAIAHGDFNGDGKPDLVTANYEANAVSVLLNNGAGGFNPAVNYNAGGNPKAVSVGDLNGDGKLDLVVANLTSFDLSVFLGKGDGTFTTGPRVTGMSYPTGVAIGDFNNDGKADLVVANSGSFLTTVVYGNGDGTFAFGFEHFNGEGGMPYAVTAGDFNKDGKHDFAVAFNSNGKLGVYLNLPSGFVNNIQMFPAGAQPIAIAAGDFNADGVEDVAVANYGSQNVTVVVGIPAGGTVTTIAVGSLPESLVTVDLNGDQAQDLIVGNAGTNFVSLLTATSSGQFTRQDALGVESPSAVAATDFDGDGQVDVIVADYWVNRITTYRGSCESTSSLEAAGALKTLRSVPSKYDGYPNVRSGNGRRGNTTRPRFQ